MDAAGDEFLARPSLTRDQNRGIAWRHFGNARKYNLQSRRASNDLLKHRGLVDFLAKCQVFLPQSLFRSLTVFDIRTRDIPAPDPPVITYRVVSSEKPAITAVTFAQPQFQFEGGAI